MEPASLEQIDSANGGTALRRVHTITDRFALVNTYLVEEARCIVVDPGPALNIHLLQEYLKRFLGRSIHEIDLIVLTHLHPDLRAGVSALRRLCAAPVAASALIQQRPAAYQEKFSPFLSGQSIDNTVNAPSNGQELPLIDLWLKDVESLPGHPDWRVIASPGSTAESLCLYNPFSRELLCGNTMSTLRASKPLLHSGSSRAQLAETLRIVRGLQIHYLYPRHGRAILAQHPLNKIELE